MKRAAGVLLLIWAAVAGVHAHICDLSTEFPAQSCSTGTPYTRCLSHCQTVFNNDMTLMNFCTEGCAAFSNSFSQQGCNATCAAFCMSQDPPDECASDDPSYMEACETGCVLHERNVLCCNTCSKSCNGAFGTCQIMTTHQQCTCNSGYTGPYCLKPPGAASGYKVKPSTNVLGKAPYVGTTISFGWSLDADGSLLAIGAEKGKPPHGIGSTPTGAVYTYHCPTNSLADCVAGSELTGTGVGSGSKFGNFVRVSGSLVAVAVNLERRAFVFDCPTASTCSSGYELQPFETAPQWFGKSLAVHGRTVVVGAYGYSPSGKTGMGSAYVFDCPTAATCNSGQRIEPSDGLASQFAGYATVVYGDIVAIGAPGASVGGVSAGAVHLFNCPSGGATCTPGLKITSPLTSAGFGTSLAMHGELLVVGAPQAVSNKGYVYVYNCTSAMSCTLGSTLIGANTASNDQFGHSVDVRDGLVVVGAPYRKLNGYSTGYAYVFSCPTAATCSAIFETYGHNFYVNTHGYLGYDVTVGPGYIAAGAPLQLTINGTGYGGAVIMEPVCPAGRFGPTCEGSCTSVLHCAGDCSDGLDGNGGGCPACEVGWTGPNCDECAPGRRLFMGQCICDVGYYGPSCTPCPQQCNGLCKDGHAGDGTCSCPPGFLPYNNGCDECQSGHFGPTCTACASCNGHGDCNEGFSGDGECTCEEGYDPAERCGACLPNYEDQDPTEGVNCQPIQGCPAITFDHATFPHSAFDSEVYGTCDIGYSGNPTWHCNDQGEWDGPLMYPCEPIVCPSVFENNILWPQTQVMQNGTGECDYGTTGSPQRACLLVGNVGEWDTTVLGDCVTIKCPSGVEGNATFEVTQYEQVAEGTCIAGHMQQNGLPPTRYCNGYGEWEEVENPCIRRTCAGEAYLWATYPTTESMTNATGTCAAGYMGSPVRLCQETGYWSSTLYGTSCYRPACPPETAGHAHFGQHYGGDTAIGSCEAKHDQTNGVNPTRYCQPHGEWADVVNPCVRRQCPSSTIAGAFYNTTLGGDYQYGVCPQNMTGTPMRLCLVTGEWSWQDLGAPCYTLGTCSATTLGNANFVAAYYGSSIMGTCLPGYGGNATATCNNGGTWTLVTDGCEINKCSPATLDHAQFPTTDALQEATGVCAQNYTGAPTRTCQSDGQWSSTPGGTPCTLLGACSAAVVGDAASFPTAHYYQTVTGVCPEGYAGTPTAKCEDNGSWSLIDDCIQLGTCPAGAVGDNNATFPETWHNQTATGVCPEGYGGGPIALCRDNGTWLMVEDDCSRLKCYSVVYDNALYPVANSSTVANGACEAGYVGAPTRACLINGTWSDEIGGTPCTPIQQGACPATLMGNANFAATAYNQTATGTCQLGYNGSATAFCSEAYGWMLTVNGCTRLQCQGGNFQNALFPTANSLTQSNGVCHDTFSGAPVRYCLANGTWSDQLAGTPCTGIKCPAVTVGYAQFPETFANTVATGTCTGGTIGSATRTCNATGHWVDLTNTCKLPPCPTVTEGWSTWPETDRNGTVNATCQEGYGGIAPRTCLSNGQWSNTTTLCKRLRCPTITQFNITWQETESMTYGTGSCIAGFMSQNTPTRYCYPGGVWHPVYSYECVPSVACVNPVTVAWPVGGLHAGGGRALTIMPDVRYASCFQPNGTVKITYTLSPEVASVKSLLSLGGTYVRIPEDRVPVGNYTLTANLTIAGQNIVVTSSTSLMIVPRPPEIVLDNAASWRYVAADRDSVLINASLSRNPNPGGDAPTCVITCFAFSGMCPWPSINACEAVALADTLFAPGDMYLTVTVTAVTAGQVTESSASVWLQVVPTLAAQVIIYDPAPTPGGYVNPSETVRLSAGVWFYGDPVPVTFQWESVAVADQHLLPLDNTTLVAGTGATGMSLVIRGGVLQPGKYTFGVTVSSSVGGSYAEFVMQVSQKPQIGGFSVSPTDGTSLSTSFVFTVTGAEDPDGEALTFQFVYAPVGYSFLSLGSLPPPQPVAFFAVSNPLAEVSLSTIPPGNFSIFCIVYDESGAWTISDAVDVSIEPPVLTPEEIVDTVLADALDQQDPNVILQVVDIILGALPPDADDDITAALLDAVNTAQELLGDNPDAIPNILSTLGAIVPIMDEATYLYTLSNLVNTARASGDAPAPFLDLAVSLMEFRPSRNETIYANESAIIQESLDALLFAVLEGVSCDEPPTVVESSGLAVLAALQSNFANETAALPGVNVRFGSAFSANDGPVVDPSQCRQLHQISQTLDPYAYATDASYSTLASILSISLYAANEEPIPVSGLTADEKFTFRFDVVIEDDVNQDDVSCIYWNTTLQDWDSAGCAVSEIAPTHVECTCDHLTTFTIGIARITLNLVDPADDIFRLPNLPRTKGGAATVAAVVVLCFVFAIALLLAIRGDREDRALQLLPTLQEIGSFVNRYFALYGRPVDESVVETVHLRELSRAYELHRYDEDGDRGPKARPSVWDNMRVHAIFALRTQHAWISLFFRPLGTYTRADRVAVTFAITNGSLAVNALFYEFGNDPVDAAVLASRAVTAFLSSMIVMIPTATAQFLLHRTRRRSPVPGAREVKQYAGDEKLPLKMGLDHHDALHRHAPWQTKLLDWMLPWWMSIFIHAILSVGAILCIYVTLLYGATFTDAQATAWIESFFISIALSILVWQPLSAIATATINTYFNHKKAKKRAASQMQLETYASSSEVMMRA